MVLPKQQFDTRMIFPGAGYAVGMDGFAVPQRRSNASALYVFRMTCRSPSGGEALFANKELNRGAPENFEPARLEKFLSIKIKW